MLFPVCSSVFQRGNEPVAVLCVPPSLTLFVFFPPLFSHLICSSFCWTLLGPSPPSLPLSPPTTSQCIPHSLPPPLLLSPSFIIPPSATRPGSSLPWVFQVHSVMKDGAGQGAGLCPAQARAMGSVYSRGSYVNGACIFM